MRIRGHIRGIAAGVLCAVVVTSLVLQYHSLRPSHPAIWSFDSPRQDQVNTWGQAAGLAHVSLQRPTRLPANAGKPRIVVRGIPGDPTRPVAVRYHGLHLVEAPTAIDPQIRDNQEVVAYANDAWSAKIQGTVHLFVRRGATLAELWGRSVEVMISVAESFHKVKAVHMATTHVALPSMAVQSTTYVNPVIHTDFADPTILRASDGWYYAYSTESLTIARIAYIQAARSHDLAHWQMLPDAMPIRPKWASRMRDFWAPGVIEGNGRYYLYFAANPNRQTGMCLGVATSSNAAGPFVDSGKPLRCGSGFVNIDPMPFDDPRTGKHFLYWGSDGSPILGQELASDRIRFAAHSRPISLLAPNASQPYETLVEAPFMFYHQGYYYLLYSGDNCCSRPPSYAVMVARSRGPLKPFTERSQVTSHWGESTILHFNDRWEGTGHCAVLTDAAGHDWVFYHAIDPRNWYNPGTRSALRPMLMDRMTYRAGWPRIANDVPSTTPQRAPTVN